MVLNKRAEILFSNGEYEELKREAKRRRVSVGELVREAVRRTYLVPSAERRHQAFERLINGPEIDVGSWDEAKKLIGRWVDKEPDA